MNRPSWDQHFLNLAAVAGEMSPCCRRQVGTVLVRDKHVLSSGFNGPPRGAPHRDASTCVRSHLPSGADPDKVCCAHSEANAVALAAYHGHATKGATAYVTILPCATCARILINAGVVRVVYADAYPNADSFAVFAESGIPVEKIGAAAADVPGVCSHGGEASSCPWCIGARMAAMHDAPAPKPPETKQEPARPTITKLPAPVPEPCADSFCASTCLTCKAPELPGPSPAAILSGAVPIEIVGRATRVYEIGSNEPPKVVAVRTEKLTGAAAAFAREDALRASTKAKAEAVEVGDGCGAFGCMSRASCGTCP